MNCNNYNTIRVTAGNAFSLLLPLKEKQYVSEQPIEEVINAALLTDVQVLLNNEEWSEFELGEDGVLVHFPSTLSKGVYNIELTAKYGGIAIRAAYFQCLSIVAWSYQADAENYIPTSPLVADAAFIISVNGDEELTALKEQYRNAIAATEAEKAEYERKLQELDGVAQESTSQEILEEVSGMGAVANELQSGKQAIVDAINHMGGEATEGNTLTDLANKINGLSVYKYEGVEFADDVEVPHPLSIGFVIANRNKVKKIVDHTTKTTSYYGSTTTGGIVRGNSYIEYVEYSALEDAGPGGSFSVCPKLEIVLVPKIKTIGTNSFQQSGLLKIVDVRSLTSWSGLIFQGTVNVIDLIIGGGFNSNVDTGAYYNPTGAYSKTSSSLCFDTDMDRYGQTFANNWEKWKWCIINHWAANLQDRTNMNAYTITFGVKKVLEQFDDEMIAAFTNKNWNLA